MSSFRKTIFMCWTLLRSVLLLTTLSGRFAMASPVTSPEVESTRTLNSNIPHHHHKPTLQDAQLNSLTVYATNYDAISNAANEARNDFKPSFKLPQMETSFTPIQNDGSGNSAAVRDKVGGRAFATSTPMFMQHLPQTLGYGGIQYLQLMPTRPLMVPLPQFPGGDQSLGYSPSLNMGGGLDYTPPVSATLTASPANSARPATTPLLDMTSHQHIPPFGFQTYANALPPYRHNYRIHREAQGRLPSELVFNLDEFIPGPHASPHLSHNRGRP